MKALLYLFAVLITIFACNRKIQKESSAKAIVDTAIVRVSSGPGQKLPICIAAKIDSIKQQPVWNPPAEVHEYEKDEKKVYVISANCCDFFTIAVDESCSYVCAPSGGFAGKGDSKCPTFFQEAKHIRMVWKDDRQRK